jgi:hypothetical protein
VEETAKRQKLGLLRIKVTLENNCILITNEESGLIWKSYSVGQKTCTACKRECESQDLHSRFTDSDFATLRPGLIRSFQIQSFEATNSLLEL